VDSIALYRLYNADNIAHCPQWTCRKRKCHVFKNLPTVP